MKKPTFTIIVDCHGEPLALSRMHYAANLVCTVIGSDKTDRSFWMTQSDILHELEAQGQMPIRIDDRKWIEGNRFYEDSMDLYLMGEIKPIARIVNFKMPEWSER